VLAESPNEARGPGGPLFTPTGLEGELDPVPFLHNSLGVCCLPGAHQGAAQPG